MSDQDQQAAHLLEQSEAGLLSASDALSQAHGVLCIAQEHEATALAYHEAALASRREAQRKLNRAVRLMRFDFAVLALSLVFMIVGLVA